MSVSFSSALGPVKGRAVGINAGPSYQRIIGPINLDIEDDDFITTNRNKPFVINDQMTPNGQNIYRILNNIIHKYAILYCETRLGINGNGTGGDDYIKEYRDAKKDQNRLNEDIKNLAQIIENGNIAQPRPSPAQAPTLAPATDTDPATVPATATVPVTATVHATVPATAPVTAPAWLDGNWLEDPKDEDEHEGFLDGWTGS